MEPMIYKLNLPQLPECILDGVEERYFKDNADPHYIGVEPDKIFKPEYLILKNFNWFKVLIFYRNFGTSCPIHTDTANTRETVWGINWIYKGQGLMEYWELEDFEPQNIKYYVDNLGFPTFRCFKPTKSPRLRYFLNPGAYLVNTTKVHRATSFKNRYCVSYRSTTTLISWNNIVDQFSDVIVDNLPIFK